MNRRELRRAALALTLNPPAPPEPEPVVTAPVCPQSTALASTIMLDSCKLWVGDSQVGMLAQEAMFWKQCDITTLQIGNLVGPRVVVDNLLDQLRKLGNNQQLRLNHLAQMYILNRFVLTSFDFVVTAGSNDGQDKVSILHNVRLQSCYEQDLGGITLVDC